MINATSLATEKKVMKDKRSQGVTEIPKDLPIDKGKGIICLLDIRRT